MLGKLFTCWYNKKNEPRIVIGPDFAFSLVEMGLVNGIVGAVLNNMRTQEIWYFFYGGLALLITHNFAFMATVMFN